MIWLDNLTCSLKIQDLTVFLYSLQKKVADRANYSELLSHPFLLKSEEASVDMSTYVTEVLAKDTSSEAASNEWSHGYS